MTGKPGPVAWMDPKHVKKYGIAGVCWAADHRTGNYSVPLYAFTAKEREAMLDALTRVLAGEHDGEIPIRFYEQSLDKLS